MAQEHDGTLLLSFGSWVVICNDISSASAISLMFYNSLQGFLLK